MSYQSQVLADTPVLYLRFEETSGATCADLSGNGFNGTAAGTFTRNVSMLNAGLGVGITLGGAAADHVTVADVATLDITGAVTYEVWIKPTSLNPVNVIMSKGNGGANLGGYNLYCDDFGLVKLNNANAGGTIVQTGNGAVAAGSLFHVVATRDGSNACVLYINGVSAGTNSTANVINANSEPFTIGAQSSAGGTSFASPFPGTLDEVAVYNYALSLARVQAHYNARAQAGGAASSGGAVGVAATFAAVKQGFQLKGQGQGKAQGPKPPQPPQSTAIRRRNAADLRRRKGV